MCRLPAKGTTWCLEPTACPVVYTCTGCTSTSVTHTFFQLTEYGWAGGVGCEWPSGAGIRGVAVLQRRWRDSKRNRCHRKAQRSTPHLRKQQQKPASATPTKRGCKRTWHGARAMWHCTARYVACSTRPHSPRAWTVVHDACNPMNCNPAYTTCTHLQTTTAQVPCTSTSSSVSLPAHAVLTNERHR